MRGDEGAQRLAVAQTCLVGSSSRDVEVEQRLQQPPQRLEHRVCFDGGLRRPDDAGDEAQQRVAVDRARGVQLRLHHDALQDRARNRGPVVDRSAQQQPQPRSAVEAAVQDALGLGGTAFEVRGVTFQIAEQLVARLAGAGKLQRARHVGDGTLPQKWPGALRRCVRRIVVRGRLRPRRFV